MNLAHRVKEESVDLLDLQGQPGKKDHKDLQDHRDPLDLVVKEESQDQGGNPVWLGLQGSPVS